MTHLGRAARETDLGDYAGWLGSGRIVGKLRSACCDLCPAR
jgi:hypothetical protein